MFRTAGVTLLGCVALSLTGCGFRSVSDEPVTLDAVRGAVVVSGGTERAAADGAKLGKGDRVRTGATGTATLVVRGRRVVLGGGTDVTVPDGATVDLTTGALLVDRRHGPGLTLHAGDTTIDDVGEGALRVERTFSVSVAGLSAGARLRTATGSRLSLPALYQARAAGRALPGAGAPLQLRHDAWERSVIPKLLTDDDRLNDIAEGLDGPDAPVVPAAFRPGNGVRSSDVLLAEAIGRAAGDDAARRARALRDQGGSWGVVAALVETSPLDVGSALSDVLKGASASTAPASGAPSRTPGPGGVVAGPTPEPTLDGGASRTPDPTGPTTTKSPKPTSPTPTTAPPTTESIVDQIGKIIPSPVVSLGGDGLLGLG
jgi:hypothetical protein